MSSPGTVLTPRGPVQGEVIIDPRTGLPVTTTGGALNVNATVSIGTLTLDAATSSIRIEDPNTGAHVLVEMDGSINVNTSIQASQGDSVLVYGTQDGTPSGTKQVLKVNSDGSINAVVGSSGAIEIVRSTFNAITSVPSGSPALVASYTVPGGVTNGYLQRVDMSGTNIAVFDIQINSVVQGRKRTYWANFNEIAEYISPEPSRGLKLNPSDVVTVYVTHNRPTAGDFEARIQVLEVT